MIKKSLLSLYLFITLILVSSCVLATNNMGNELQSSWDKTKNTVTNVGNTVSSTIGTITNGTSNAFNQMMNTNSTTNTTDGITTNMNTDMSSMNSNANTDYNAIRTATSNNSNNTGLSNLALTWIILGITTVIIVSLIWYYGTQNKNETRVKDNNNN